MKRKCSALTGRTEEQRAISEKFKELKKKALSPFPKSRAKLNVSTRKGVYIIFNSKKKVLHVGSTPIAKGGISQRLRDHLTGRSSFVDWFLEGKKRKVRRYLFSYLEVASGRDRALLEAYAIGRLCPAHLGGESFYQTSRAKKRKQ